MKLLQKLISCAASGLLLMQSIPLSAAAAETGFSYTLKSDDTAEISCLNKSLETVEIPSEISGHKITALADNCFAECEKLKEIIIPDSVTAFGSYAFYHCSSLEGLTIPASVTEIGAYAFEATPDMTAFSVDENNPAYSSPDGVLYTKSGDTLIKYPESRADLNYAVLDSCQKIEDWAFIGAQYLEQVDLKQVQSIGEDAFCWCVSLKNITVPEGVTELPGAVFSYCENLEQVTLPSTMKTIGEQCFYSSTALKSVNLPEGLKEMGAYAFGHCTSLASLTVPKSLTNMNIDCMGYAYDEDKDEYYIQDNFTLYVYRDSMAFRYAASNHIPYEFVQTGTVYYILIAVILVIIVVLIIAIIKVLKQRRTES